LLKASFKSDAEFDDESRCLKDLQEKRWHLKDMGAVEKGIELCSFLHNDVDIAAAE